MSCKTVRLREWESLGPNDPAGLELRGVRLDSDEARRLALGLAKAGVIEVVELFDGVQVRARAHVGRIELGGLVITVEPKIGSGELLELLRYAYGLRNLRLFDETAFATTGQLLQDLIAAQLLAEAEELQRRGLAKKYVPRTELVSSPRGRIDMNDLSRRTPMIDAGVVCHHHLRSTDHLLNQVLLAGLRLGAQVAQAPFLRRSLVRLARSLATEHGEVRLGARVFEQARRRLDRLTGAYEPALRLSELLYVCSAISLDGEMSIALPGFLFDMNRFFQALMGRFLAEHLEGFVVHEEHSLSEMMRYLPGLNPRRRRSPAPRPDFVIAKGRTVAALLDAKYRDLWERDLPRDMLYQLAIYALSQGGPSVAAIVYPTTAREATDAVVEIGDPVRARALGYVAMRPVVLSNLAAAVRESAVHGDAKQLATRLAFGSAPRGGRGKLPADSNARLRRRGTGSGSA
jgi:5-methylcytosine-specific restriction enzyme subunit McrC